MSRPDSFKHSFIALRNIPYTEDTRGTGSVPRGMLCKGEVVWASNLHQQQPYRVEAFHEPVGVVCLDPRWLMPQDLFPSA